MRKIIITLMIGLPLIGFYLTGCSTLNEERYAELKYMSRVVAGGVVGDIVAGNLAGFIIGSFIIDTMSVAKIEYEDKLLEGREEAARRYKFKQAEEKMKKEEKKVEEPKEKQQKAEEKKEEDRKTEEGRKKEEKAEEKMREQKKKAEEAKNKDEQVELFIEDSDVINHIVEIGSKVKANVRYTILAPIETQQIKITEKRFLINGNTMIELAQREVFRTQGTHISTIKFTISEDMPEGYFILLTTISDGKYSKTIKSNFIINKL